LLQHVDPGFNPDHVVTLRLILNRTSYPTPPQLVNFYAQLLERVRAVPGVQSAATISTLPLSGNQTDTNFLIEGRPAPPPNQEPSAWFNSVSHDYFQTMQLRLIKGRSLSESDNEKSPLVAIISEAMARKYWPNEDPLGKRIGRGPDKWREIVGVVRDVKHFGLDSDAPPTMYFPMRQAPARGWI
jgi:putative ABC transport system permease protein